MQTVSPSLYFAQTRLCTKEITWNIQICPVVNSPADNDGEKGENKTGGEYFPVYSSTHDSTLWVLI